MSINHLLTGMMLQVVGIRLFQILGGLQSEPHFLAVFLTATVVNLYSREKVPPQK